MVVSGEERGLRRSGALWTDSWGWVASLGQIGYMAGLYKASERFPLAHRRGSLRVGPGRSGSGRGRVGWVVGCQIG